MAVSAIALVAALGVNGCSSSPLDIFETKPDFERGSLLGTAELDKPTPEKLIRVAEATRARGDLTGAMAMYRNAIAMEPDNAEAIIELGSLFLEMGDGRNAAAAFRHAAGLGNQEAHALHGLGNALVMLDRPAEAVVQYQAALAIEKSSRSYNGLGVALDMVGRHEAALDAYEKGLRFDPESVSIRNNLGLSRVLAGQFSAAIDVLREAASHPQATARERQNLALAYGMAGEPDLAARIARVDLGETQVESNLTFYAWLRQQPTEVAALTLRRGETEIAAPEGSDQLALGPRLPVAERALAPGLSDTDIGEPADRAPAAHAATVDGAPDMPRARDLARPVETNEQPVPAVSTERSPEPTVLANLALAVDRPAATPEPKHGAEVAPTVGMATAKPEATGRETALVDTGASNDIDLFGYVVRLVDGILEFDAFRTVDAEIATAAGEDTGPAITATPTISVADAETTPVPDAAELSEDARSAILVEGEPALRTKTADVDGEAQQSDPDDLLERRRQILAQLAESRRPSVEEFVAELFNRYF